MVVIHHGSAGNWAQVLCRAASALVTTEPSFQSSCACALTVTFSIRPCVECVLLSYWCSDFAAFQTSCVCEGCSAVLLSQRHSPLPPWCVTQCSFWLRYACSHPHFNVLTFVWWVLHHDLSCPPIKQPFCVSFLRAETTGVSSLVPSLLVSLCK